MSKACTHLPPLVDMVAVMLDPLAAYSTKDSLATPAVGDQNPSLLKIACIDCKWHCQHWKGYGFSVLPHLSLPEKAKIHFEPDFAHFFVLCKVL